MAAAGNAVIGALRVNLGIDSANFQTGLKSAQKGLSAVATQAKIVAAAVAAAGGAIALAMTTITSKAADTKDVAERLGVAVEALQELRHAAEMGGMAAQNFDVAFRRFIRRASEAAQGGGAAKDAFKELGITLRDANGQVKSGDVLLGEVANRLSAVRGPADRLRLAFKMFDTDGAAMVNVLAEGSAGLDRLRAEARALGIVMSEEAVEASARFQDNLDLLRKTTTGFATQIAGLLAPALENVTRILLSLSMSFGDLSPTVQRAVAGFGAFALAAAGLSAAFLVLKPVLAVMAGMVAALISPIGLVVAALVGAAAAVFAFRDDIQAAIGIDVVDTFKTALNFIANGAQAAVEAIAHYFTTRLPLALGNAGRAGANLFLSGIEAMANTAVGVINDLAEAFNVVFEKLPGWLGKNLKFGKIDPIKLPRLDPPSTEKLVGEVEKINARIREIMSRDVLGDFIGIFTRSTGLATAAFRDFADGLAGGAGKASKELKELVGDLDAAQKALGDYALTKATEAERAAAPFLAHVLNLNTAIRSGILPANELARAHKLLSEMMAAAAEAANTAQAAVDKQGDGLLRRIEHLQEETIALENGTLAHEKLMDARQVAADAAAFEADLIQAVKDGYDLQGQSIAGLVEQYRTLRAEVPAMYAAKDAQERQSLENNREMARTTQDFFSDLRYGLKSGESMWQAFSNAATRALDRITEKLLDDVIDALFQVNKVATGGGGGGGFLGGLLNIGASMFGGGSFTPAAAATSGPLQLTGIYGDGTNSAARGWGLVGERGPELIKFRGGEQVVPNHALGGGGGIFGSLLNIRDDIQAAIGIDVVDTFKTALNFIANGAQAAVEAIAHYFTTRLGGPLLGASFGGGTFYAGGGVSAAPTLTGIYGDGTRSAARGWGLVGERGPELIKFRGGEQVVPNHALGGGGGDITFIVNDQRGAGAPPVQTRESFGSDGKRMLEMTILDTVQRGMQSGALDKTLASTYGVRRRARG